MKRALLTVFVVLVTTVSFGQLAEWRLVNPVFNPADPDGAGPSTGSVSFTFQVHALTIPVANVTTMTTGWSWQSANSMIPIMALSPGTGTIAPGCTTPINTPSNVVLSSTFASGGWQFNTVNECFVNNQTVGSQNFDRTVIGTLETNGGGLTLTTTWVDVYTVTMWTRNATNPRGGYVILNSTNGGAPGRFSNYELSDPIASILEANSLTYTTPLATPSATLPVSITKFDAQCQLNKTTSISWTTSQERNGNYFEVQRSVNGNDWETVTKVNGTVSSVTEKKYQINDPRGGAAQYRLKQVDIDEKITYSNIVKTSCEGRNVFVSLYPVPARDAITLIVGSDKAIKTSLQVFDNKGRMVINLPATIVNGTNNFKIQVQNLAAGEYIIRSADVNIEINKRFTVIR